MTDKEFWDISFAENQAALAAHHQQFKLPAYPSIQIPINKYGRDILEIRATFVFGDNEEGLRVIQKIYWVIARNNHVFTKNKHGFLSRATRQIHLERKPTLILSKKRSHSLKNIGTKLFFKYDQIHTA